MSGAGYRLIGDAEQGNVLQALQGTLTRYRYGQPGDPSFVYQFERAVEKVFVAPHCLATNSCTSALLAALAALGIGPGDEVLVPGYTFIATIAAIVHSGATPVLCEIDDTLTLDSADVERKITGRSRAIMPVHMMGAPADMDAIMTLARAHGLLVVEDAAQACGGRYRGRALGTIGDVGAHSLNYFKVITAGEGGFLLTSSAEVYERAYAFHDHGFKPMRDGASEANSLFGMNLRMSDLTGAVALAQFERLDAVLTATRRVNAALAEAIGTLPGLRRRRRVDAPGDCATSLIYLFDDAEIAAKVAAALDTTVLRSSGRHYYGNMPQLQALASGHRGPAPFRGRPDSALSDCGVGTLPQTDDLLARAVGLSTGVSDWYAGTGFGVRLDSSAEEVAAAGARFREVVEWAQR